ncbi:MAG: DUF2254 domain-containing protein [Beijerinckiaceae bacterium]|nr:DUF2254 domain-containing protein [Beijerinckiaceae bacterium]
MVRLRNIVAHIRAQLWLLPALMAVGAALLAYVALSYGGVVRDLAGDSAWWLYSGDASTARNLLAAFLSGLITMTSLVVSVTIVILTTAASQLGPRLIAYFMGDRQIQFVLGLFLGTTLYVVIVMRTLNDELGDEGIPHAAVTVASLMTIACVFALLFYVHKIARSVIADNLVEQVCESLLTDIRDILDEEAGDDDPEPVSMGDRQCSSISLGRAGYIQLIDYEQLVKLASKHDVIIRLNVRAGHFVLANGTHVEVWDGAEGGETLADEIRKTAVIGSTRTSAQDLEHGLRQLVEIGLRSLSPGINDPFTAATVIDRIGSTLENIFERRLPPHFLADEAGEVRVIADRSDLTGLIGAAFNQIRQAGAGQPAIILALAETLRRLAPSAHQMARQALLDQLQRLEQTAATSQFGAADTADVRAAIDESRRVIISHPHVTAPVRLSA